MRKTTILWLVALLVLQFSALVGQEIPSAENREINLDTYADLLREDVRSQKVAILGQLMNLSPDEAAAFWPIYAEYDKELTGLGKERVALIKDYAEHHGSLSDEKASEISEKALDLESRRTVVKKKYFHQVAKALSGKSAARFLQIENQLLKIVDLQILANLPIVE